MYNSQKWRCEEMLVLLLKSPEQMSLESACFQSLNLHECNLILHKCRKHTKKKKKKKRGKTLGKGVFENLLIATTIVK